MTENTYESMVSFVSRRYMRGENGTGRLAVCLSEYLCIGKSKNELFEMSHILIYLCSF